MGRKLVFSVAVMGMIVIGLAASIYGVSIGIGNGAKEVIVGNGSNCCAVAGMALNNEKSDKSGDIEKCGKSSSCKDKKDGKSCPSGCDKPCCKDKKGGQSCPPDCDKHCCRAKKG